MTNANIRACNFAEAVRLLNSAITILNSGTFPESAIWRMADAAGLVAAALTPEQKKGLIGLESVTGRGNLLVQR
jgi:hypothetical protein